MNLQLILANYDPIEKGPQKPLSAFWIEGRPPPQDEAAGPPNHLLAGILKCVSAKLMLGVG